MHTRLLMIAGCLFCGSMLLTNVATVTVVPEARADHPSGITPWERLEHQLNRLHSELQELRRRVDRLE